MCAVIRIADKAASPRQRGQCVKVMKPAWTTTVDQMRFPAISWPNSKWKRVSSESATNLVDQVDAVWPTPDVLVELHRQNSGFPSIWGIKTSLLLASIRKLVSNREMLVVTEISHRSSHQNVISLHSNQASTIHNAYHLLWRIKDSGRLAKLLTTSLRKVNRFDFRDRSSVLSPAG